MPLRSGSSPEAFKANVRTLMGEVGKSPHVQSREQALAIAYAKKRAGRAQGGLVDHDQDPELPRVRDDVRLDDMLERQQEPAYIATMRRIVEGQKRLNAMHPIQREMLRRYWLGGLTYWLGGSVK